MRRMAVAALDILQQSNQARIILIHVQVHENMRFARCGEAADLAIELNGTRDGAEQTFFINYIASTHFKPNI